jgi:hypothetical protein
MSRALSSVGRALRLHRRCQGFEPSSAHHSNTAICAVFSTRTFLRYTKCMRPFFTYWYIQSWSRFYHGCVGVLTGVEDEVAIVDTLHNMDKPLFQDYSRQGRFIGFFFRLARIVAGLLALGVITVGYGALYAIWLLAPIVCLVAVAVAFFGGTA